MNLAVFGEKIEFYEIINNVNLFNKENKTNVAAFFYDDFNSFLKEAKEKNFKIIFLMHSSNHPKILNLAIDLKNFNKNLNIVFCCETEEFAIVGYKFCLSQYILLPMAYEEFKFSILNSCKKEKKIIVKSNWQKILINLKDIQYAEKQGHNIIIKTISEKISTRTTFKKFIENFKDDEDFVNCVRGIIVNLNWVEKITSQSFIMKNKEKIPIRRKDRKLLKILFLKFQLRKNNWFLKCFYIIYKWYMNNMYIIHKIYIFYIFYF